MAAFRAITAEEESASAIFKALKRIGYEGAEQIDPKRHDHKAALFSLLQAIYKQKDTIDALGIKLALAIQTKAKPNKVELRIGFPQMLPLAMKPEPPLHFRWEESGIPLDLVGELEQLSSENGIKSYAAEIKRRANLRNVLLYAADKGVTFVERPVDSMIQTKKEIVFNNLLILLMIDQTMEKQLFVQQCVDCLLKIIRGRKTNKVEAASDAVANLAAAMEASFAKQLREAPANDALYALAPVLHNFIDALRSVRGAYSARSMHGVVSGARAIFENMLATEIIKMDRSLARKYLDYGAAGAHIFRFSNTDIFNKEEQSESENELLTNYLEFVKLDKAGAILRRDDGSVIDKKWHGKASIAALAHDLGFGPDYKAFYSFACNFTHVNANTHALSDDDGSVDKGLAFGSYSASNYAFNGLLTLAEIARLVQQHKEEFGRGKNALEAAERLVTAIALD